MSRNVDREDVLSFVSEAKGYLPEIERGILEFATDPSKADELFESFRLTHTIKGCSSMVGLSCLSHIAYYQEEVLEDLATGRSAMSREAEDLLSATMSLLDLYLDALLKGDCDGPALLTEAVIVYRRYRGLPEQDDESAIAQILHEAQLADQDVVIVDHIDEPTFDELEELDDVRDVLPIFAANDEPSLSAIEEPEHLAEETLLHDQNIDDLVLEAVTDANPEATLGAEIVEATLDAEIVEEAEVVAESEIEAEADDDDDTMAVIPGSADNWKTPKFEAAWESFQDDAKPADASDIAESLQQIDEDELDAALANPELPIDDVFSSRTSELAIFHGIEAPELRLDEEDDHHAHTTNPLESLADAVAEVPAAEHHVPSEGTLDELALQASEAVEVTDAIEEMVTNLSVESQESAEETADQPLAATAETVDSVAEADLLETPEFSSEIDDALVTFSPDVTTDTSVEFVAESHESHESVLADEPVAEAPAEVEITADSVGELVSEAIAEVEPEVVAETHDAVEAIVGLETDAHALEFSVSEEVAEPTVEPVVAEETVEPVVAEETVEPVVAQQDVLTDVLSEATETVEGTRTTELPEPSPLFSTSSEFRAMGSYEDGEFLPNLVSDESIEFSIDWLEEGMAEATEDDHVESHLETTVDYQSFQSGTSGTFDPPADEPAEVVVDSSETGSVELPIPTVSSLLDETIEIPAVLTTEQMLDAIERLESSSQAEPIEEQSAIVAEQLVASPDLSAEVGEAAAKADSDIDHELTASVEPEPILEAVSAENSERVADQYLDELDALLDQPADSHGNVLLSESQDASLLDALKLSDANDMENALLKLVDGLDSSSISSLLGDDITIVSGSVDGEHLEVFQLEAKELVRKIVARLAEYRINPDPAALGETRTMLHSIKGGAGAVGMVSVAVCSHRIEDLVDSLIKSDSKPSEESLARLFASIDVLEDLLEGRMGDEDAFQTLEILFEESDAPAAQAPQAEHAKAPVAKPHVSAFGPGSAIPAIDLDDMGSVPSEVLEIFAQEAEDHIRSIYQTLGELEREPANRELLQSVRRSAHTLKGAAGAVKLRAVTQLSHRMEDLLDHRYDHEQPIDDDTRALLFETTDVLNDLTENKYDRETMRATILGLFERYVGLVDAPAKSTSVESTRVETPVMPIAAEAIPTQHVSESLPSIVPTVVPAPAPTLAPVSRPLAAEAAPSVVEVEGFIAPPSAPVRSSAPRKKVAAAQAPKRSGEVLRVPIERIDELVRLVSELVINRTGFEQRMLDMAKTLDEHRRSIERLRQVASELETQYETRALAGRRFSDLIGPANGDGATSSANGGNNTNRLQQFFLNPIRDEFDDLEFDRYTKFHLLSRSLAEATSDLSTLDNELHNSTGDFDTLLTRQGRLSREIQDKLMRVRMVPLGTLTTNLHRAVRVVAQQQNKLVDLVLEGDHTELDKTVLEEMSDAFLHLLRNAVDHGIEPSPVRLVRGKPERATIKVRASYQGTQVVIQVEDDGGGIDPENIRAAAVRNGQYTAEDAARLSPQELYQLIFLPGFSTATEISEISGRGVGMEIVKVKVHKLKGTLEVDSEVGKGTTFTIRLPMTLAITRALMIRCNNESFAIPAQSVSQILRVDRREIEKIGHEPVLRLAGKVYPLLRLGDVLQLRQPPDESRNMLPVLVVDSGTRQVTVVVDQIEASREIVVKTLGSQLRRVRGMIGATLLGDGTVVPILNLIELVQEGTRIDVRGATAPTRSATGGPAKADDPWSVLVVDDSVSVRRVVANLIKGEGWNPIVAKDGLDALEVLQGLDRAPDLVLLDIEMPRMDGYELLSRLRSQPAYRDLPVVMVTSRAGEKHRKKAMELGATEYVVKPYQDEVMVSLIHRLVSQSREMVHV